MRPFFSSFVALVLFSIGTSWPLAANDLKTLGLPTGELIEYVEVRDEPRHRHKFENDRVRLYDVLIPQGDTTLYHRHAQNTAYVVIQPSRFRTQLAGGPPVEADLHARAAFFDTQAEKPIIHQVSNIGDRAARLIGVEIYKTDKTLTREPLAATGLNLFQSHPQLRIYYLALEPRQSTGVVDANISTVTVALTSGRLISKAGQAPDYPNEPAELMPGDYRWSENSGPHETINVGDTTFHAVLYELP